MQKLNNIEKPKIALPSFQCENCKKILSYYKNIIGLSDETFNQIIAKPLAISSWIIQGKGKVQLLITQYRCPACGRSYKKYRSLKEEKR